MEHSLRKFIYAATLILTALTSTTLEAANIKLPKAKHIDAVGAVFIIEGKTASIGTGTYIGNRRILTAGHLFKSVLPKSVPQETGPIKIDIRDKRVFWSNDPSLDLSNPPAVFYRTTHITVDAKFINAFNNNLVDPDQEDVKSDIAILTLEKDVVGVKEVSLPNSQLDIPVEGLLVGYGRDKSPGHRKKAAPQALHGLTDMGDWAIIISNLIADMQSNPLLRTPVENKEMETLLAKDPLDLKDLEIKRATQGDSGGPLLIATDDNKVHILGIMSANSKMFNAFAALVVKTPVGVYRSHKFDALLNEEATRK